MMSSNMRHLEVCRQNRASQNRASPAPLGLASETGPSLPLRCPNLVEKTDREWPPLLRMWPGTGMMGINQTWFPDEKWFSDQTIGCIGARSGGRTTWPKALRNLDSIGVDSGQSVVVY